VYLFNVVHCLFGSCVLGKRVVKTSTGYDEGREMGMLTLKTEVKKSVVKNGRLSLYVRVTVVDPNPIIKTDVYKFENGKEIFVGSTDEQGYFRIRTTFSCPDTFSFVAPTSRKKYLYVGDCR
jgi:hypothetical protein